jgi:hypothetical protein
MPVAVADGTPVEPPPGAAASPVNDVVAILPVPYWSQGGDNLLCWAACGEMVFNYYNVTDISMCQMQSQVLGAACCDNPQPAGCNAGAWPPRLYQAFSAASFSCEYSSGGPLGPPAIQTEIVTYKRPVQTLLQWTDANAPNEGGTHTSLIVGLYTNGDLHVLDPYYEIGRQSYEYISDAYGLGAWISSWYDIFGPQRDA